MAEPTLKESLQRMLKASDYRLGLAERRLRKAQENYDQEREARRTIVGLLRNIYEGNIPG